MDAQDKHAAGPKSTATEPADASLPRSESSSISSAERHWGPRDYLGWGLTWSVAGGVVIGAMLETEPVGAFIIGGALGALGSVMLSIGIVAKGVEAGIRSSRGFRSN